MKRTWYAWLIIGLGLLGWGWSMVEINGGVPETTTLDRSAQAPDAERYRQVSSVVLGATAGSEGADPSTEQGLLLSEGSPFSWTYRTSWEELGPPDHCWLQVRCNVGQMPGTTLGKVALVTTFSHDSTNYGYKAVWADPYSTNVNGRVEIEYWYLASGIKDPMDELQVYAWLQEGEPVRVSDLEIAFFQPRDP